MNDGVKYEVVRITKKGGDQRKLKTIEQPKQNKKKNASTPEKNKIILEQQELKFISKQFSIWQSDSSTRTKIMTKEIGKKYLERKRPPSVKSLFFLTPISDSRLQDVSENDAGEIVRCTGI